MSDKLGYSGDKAAAEFISIPCYAILYSSRVISEGHEHPSSVGGRGNPVAILYSSRVISEERRGYRRVDDHYEKVAILYSSRVISEVSSVV